MQQYMLLTNISVAQHIAVHLPEQALLRRHDTPLDRRLVRVFLFSYSNTTPINPISRLPSVSAQNDLDTRWTLPLLVL